MRLYSAMALYKARKLSMGKASELAEMNKINFMCELGKYDIPAINYDVDEFKEELEWIKTKEGYNHNPNKKNTNKPILFLNPDYAEEDE